ncbi:hypothetical protein GLOIN_2v321204 [Rhizophagus irregularis DAOM 181602=DAOM 197198]|uniref:RRM domain-containing protein n=1 Tax=Rhizophagus irregularis (strain DAOM 181602 / DAOM 197198 / MUCL 43194) TaxID=747089 RepID=A0A2P4QRX4_RHIID|nr:hypothetical protein GLOIN_2v321204 [Rhizophagus irregularis DAOM 181602=DAOM 197198]POG80365.1 hypothetical protein GLOIN_2v321204 [Rhizophagus irregularis DAOM 181602=DAOM 197198]GET50244.1 hypothetical protein GLOIN_2v321204 [Rhizophagus irregularis DAOM 181602=DAOM 197198]|eukprot:XP_025187231.1 hypothetical protein GLOIN_2v321204 [Rhizophagus irregularis DAOM 181602=DAOM 197198]
MAPLNLNASPKGKFLFHTSPIKSQKQIFGNFLNDDQSVHQVNLNFDQSDRSKGIASIVFVRKNDAVQSVET